MPEEELQSRLTDKQRSRSISTEAWRISNEEEHYDSSPSPGSCYDTASESGPYGADSLPGVVEENLARQGLLPDGYVRSSVSEFQPVNPFVPLSEAQLRELPNFATSTMFPQQRFVLPDVPHGYTFTENMMPGHLSFVSGSNTVISNTAFNPPNLSQLEVSTVGGTVSPILHCPFHETLVLTVQAVVLYTVNTVCYYLH